MTATHEANVAAAAQTAHQAPAGRLPSSLILFVCARDGELGRCWIATEDGERFLRPVWALGIPYFFAGAITKADGQDKPRDIAWTAAGSHVVALGEEAATECRRQGVEHEVFPDPETASAAEWAELERQLHALAARLPLDQHRYRAVRDHLFTIGFKSEWEWGQSVEPPATAEQFAMEACWVICCSGFKEQAARKTQAAVHEALHAGRSATAVFPKSGKGRAIDKIWATRHERFAEFLALRESHATPEALVAWIAKLPYVGGRIIRYHFAKNLGVDCAKPDRWLCRLAGVPEDGPVEENFKVAMDLCRGIAKATGDRLAAVDLVLWRACNLGILTPAPVSSS